MSLTLLTSQRGNDAVAVLNAAISQVNALTDALASESANRASADASESSNRIAADASEVTNRANQDGYLQNQISQLTSAVIAAQAAANAAQASINTETAGRIAEVGQEADARADAVNALQAQINTETAGRIAEVGQEADARAAAINAVQAAINTETAGRITEVSQEADIRSAADAALQTAVAALQTAVTSLTTSLAAEMVARTDADQQVVTTLGAAALLSPNKIGDNPFLFTPGLAGMPPDLPSMPTDAVISTAIGRVYRATGQGLIATRRAVWAEAGRIDLVRFNYARFASPSDPSSDAIECGIAFLDQNFALLSQLAIHTDTQLAPATGMKVVACRVPSQPGDAVAITLPAGCTYWRPYLKSYGLDGVTDFIAITVADITEVGAFSPDLTALANRLATLESTVAAQSPLAAGVANGLATLNASGTIIQLPSLKAAFLTQAEALVPGAAAQVDNAVALSANTALALDNAKNPYVVAGSAWVAFAQTTLGLTAAQVATLLKAIGTPAQTGGTTTPAVLFTLNVETAAVLRSARTALSTITGASMKAFISGCGATDPDVDAFYLVNIAKRAPVNGGLYNLLATYLTTTAPDGPGLSQAAATAQLTTIWNAASSFDS